MLVQVIPIPVPTAVIVVAGMLAKMNETTVLLVIFCSKAIQLTLGSVALKMCTENMTPEEYIRQTFKGEEATGDKKAD